LRCAVIYVARGLTPLFRVRETQAPWWAAAWRRHHRGRALSVYLLGGLRAPQPIGRLTWRDDPLRRPGSGRFRHPSTHGHRGRPSEIRAASPRRDCSVTAGTSIFGDLAPVRGVRGAHAAGMTGIVPSPWPELRVRDIPAHDAYLAARYRQRIRSLRAPDEEVDSVPLLNVRCAPARAGGRASAPAARGSVWTTPPNVRIPEIALFEDRVSADHPPAPEGRRQETVGHRLRAGSRAARGCRRTADGAPRRNGPSTLNGADRRAVPSRLPGSAASNGPSVPDEASAP